MKLLTAAIIKQLERNPLYSTDGKNEAPVLVKFFVPWNNWTWYAVEAVQEGNDWRFFGLVEGHERELGYWVLSDFDGITGPGGLKIERDRYFDGMVLDKKAMTVGKAVAA